MKNRINKYFFHEFTRYFAVVLGAISLIIWVTQAVNFLDLVTDDGHAFRIYLIYSFLVLPKMFTKLITFSFLIALFLTILKLEKDNELIILWTAGLNKIHIVNLIFRISLIVMALQLLMSSIITPKTLNISRDLLKNSELQFVPSLLKEKEFNDTVEGLTIFVNNKVARDRYENIFIRDDGNVLTKVTEGSSTIFARSGYIDENETNLILLDGNIQKMQSNGAVSLVKFEKTKINFSGLSTKSISEPKIQETSTIQLLKCWAEKYKDTHNCARNKNNFKDNVIEINKRFGTPFFIPLIALITSFLLLSRKEKKNPELHKYLYGLIGFLILVISEITVRYSGLSFNHAVAYYLIPIGLLPLIYFLLIRIVKYENLN